MDAVVDDADQLTPRWLTEALQSSGHAVDVSDVSVERIGSGQMGRTFRLRLSTRGEGGPSTLVAKLAGEDRETRSLVAPGYAAEVGFYTRIAPELDIRTPKAWYGAITDDRTSFTLLLEDVAPAAPGVQVNGCSVREAGAALRTLIGLHVPLWDSRALYDLDFLMRPDPAAASLMAAVMTQATESFIERYARDLHADDPRTLRDACSVIERWQLAPASPFAVLHGDYRLDNLLVDPGTGEVTAVDWQTAAIGPPLRDVAYFLGTSLLSETRAAEEQGLVGGYHAALLECGVSGYSLEQCWTDYRLGQLQGPMITVIGCIYAGAERSERSDAMFIAMARRSCVAVRELGSLELV